MGNYFARISEKMDFDHQRFDGSFWCGHTGHGGADAEGVWMTRYFGNGANQERLEIDRHTKTKKGERVKVWLSCAAGRRPWIQGDIYMRSYDQIIKKLASLPEAEYHLGPQHIYSLLFEDF